MKYFIIYEEFTSGDEGGPTPYLVKGLDMEQAKQKFIEWNEDYKNSDRYETTYGNCCSIHSMKEVSEEDFKVLVKHLTESR